jgi:hypothetical protein
VERDKSPIIIGILLIVLGILFFLQSLGVLGVLADLIWSGLFAAAGLVFLYVFLTGEGRWWAAIPGMALLGIGALIGMDTLLPRLADVLGGAVFLGALALAFWLIYFSHTEMWWAVIPGGVLLTLAGVTIIDQLPVGIDGGALFMLGIGATFILLSFLRPEGKRLTWALIPGGILIVIGLSIWAAAENLLVWVLPVGLLLAGLYLVIRSVTARPAE